MSSDKKINAITMVQRNVTNDIGVCSLEKNEKLLTEMLEQAIHCALSEGFEPHDHEDPANPHSALIEAVRRLLDHPLYAHVTHLAIPLPKIACANKVAQGRDLLLVIPRITQLGFTSH